MNDGLPRSDMMIGRRVPPRKAAAKTPTKRGPVKRAAAERTVTAKAPAKRTLPTVEMQDLEDFNESINFLVYGNSGVGKTPFAAMAPNSVIISTEKGAISAKRFGSESQLIKAPTWDHVEAALDYIDKLQTTDKRREWLIIDSATKMQLLLLRWILEGEVAENEARDLDIPAIQNHQKWQNMFKRFIDRIIDMDINVIFIATAMHKEDPEGEDLVLPDIQGKDYAIAQYFCAQMDGVYYLTAKTSKKTNEPVWWLYSKTKPPYFAKDRYNALPAVVGAPTMPEVIQAILESAEYGAAAEAAAHPVIEEPEEEDVDETEEDEEEPEPTPKPARRRAATRPQAKPPVGRRAKPVAVEEPEDDDEPEEDDDDDGEDSQETHNKAVTRRQTSRRAATPAKKAAAPKRPVRKAKATKVVEEDDDLFDPEDNDEDDEFFDDEEE